MKRLTLILILAVLISLAVVTPVLAKGGGEPYKKPCQMYWKWNPYMLGFSMRNEHADGAGNPYGPMVWGIYQACHATPPKAWTK